MLTRASHAPRGATP
ncbi:hypothetical protein E2C01_070769 [Portunus trituberculatus]|uniref:Uncharacterized protein n=1 Tax=Portunus trituberculatus TaxID=210409 RepID=A0A5B7I369_PORTR|nr:hypothetical protein [Portunus trituberculatus]